MVLIRRAREVDAREMAAVHIAAWRGAYTGILSDEWLRGFDLDERAERWTESLTPPGSRRPVRHLVAEVDGRIAGIGTAGAPRDEVPDGMGELWMINLHPDWWGRGVAVPLFDGLVGVLAGFGYRSAYLTVVEGNARARRFYERRGWHPDGTHKLDHRTDPPLLELRYVCDVLPVRPGSGPG